MILLFIDPQGNVGIGNTNPLFNLDVTGTGRFTANLDVEAGLDVTGASFTIGGAYSWNTSGQILAATNETLNGIDISEAAISDVASLSFETAGNTWDAGNLQISGLLDVNGVGINDIAGTLNLSGSTLTSSSTLLINPTNNFDINIGDSDLFIDNLLVMSVSVILLQEPTSLMSKVAISMGQLILS